MGLKRYTNSSNVEYIFVCDNGIYTNCLNHDNTIDKDKLKITNDNIKIKTFIQGLIKKGWYINSVDEGYCRNCL